MVCISEFAAYYPFMRHIRLIPLALLCLLMAVPVSAQPAEPHEEFSTARVLQIIREEPQSAYGFNRLVQTVRLQLLNGGEAGTSITVENAVLDGRADMRLTAGETIVVHKITNVEGKEEYLIAEKYRLTGVYLLTGIFLVLCFLLGGWTGLGSLVGLAVSVLVLISYVVPQIVAGANPLLVSFAGSCVIAVTSLYLAHGFHRRTTVALGSTLITLSLSTVVAVLFVHATKLFGMGTEESMYLQMGSLQNVNLQGLLLGGIVIGCLGVLDDVTTAQTAAIDEIRKANPTLTRLQLWAAGFSVGKEHIASLVNTLALAYVGASLPLLLLFSTNSEYPLWVTLNSEFLVEEIVRTLVGSVTLLLAVPISTWCAATFLDGSASGHAHGHTFSHHH